MIEVFTNNGFFNISNALYESIQKNDPEIIQEVSGANNIDMIMSMLKMKYKIEGNSEQQKLVKKMLSSIDNDKLIEIVKDKTLRDKMVKKIADNLESNLQKKQIEKKAKEISGHDVSLSDKKWDEIKDKTEEEQITDVLPNDEKNLVNNISQQATHDIENNENDKKNQKIQNSTSLINKSSFDDKISLLNDFIKNPELKKEIIASEELAISLIKYIKNIDEKRIGAYGSDIQATKSFSNDAYKEDLKANNGKEIFPQSSKKGEYNYYSNKDLNDNSLRNRYRKSGIGQSVKANAKLAFGGFVLEPVAQNSEYSSVALRYIGDAMENNDSTMIGKMIKTEYKIKNNQTSNIKATKKEYQAFEYMVNRYIQNISYKMIVNSTSDFSKLINIMKYDPKLLKSFNIREMNDIRIMDSKRTIVTFVNKADSNISLLIIAEPMLARTKELVKGFAPLTNKIKNLHN